MWTEIVPFETVDIGVFFNCEFTLSYLHIYIKTNPLTAADQLNQVS